MTLAAALPVPGTARRDREKTSDLRLEDAEGEQGRVEHVFWLFKGLPEGLVSVSPTASAEGSSHVYETPGSGRLRTEGACKARGCNPSDRHQREQESTDTQEQGEASLTWK